MIHHPFSGGVHEEVGTITAGRSVASDHEKFVGTCARTRDIIGFSLAASGASRFSGVDLLRRNSVDPITPSERRRIRDRAWRAENRERLREYFRTYRAEHPELIDYYRERYLARRVLKGRRLTSPEVKREKRRRRNELYRQRHPQTAKAAVERAKAKKPVLYRQHGNASSMRRRARKAAAPVEMFDRLALWVRDRGSCHLCGRRVSAIDFSLDHLIPIARGGATSEWNLAVAHIRCNQRRGTRALFTPETREAAEAYRAVVARPVLFLEGA